MLKRTLEPLMQQAQSWADDGFGLALATVVETWGSAPCPAGSQMVINDKAAFAGSVSGGCIETSVVSESIEVLNEGEFEVVEYGVSGEVSFAAGLACGGSIKVLMEPLGKALLESLSQTGAAVRVVDLEKGSWAIVRDGKAVGALKLDGDHLKLAQSTLEDERARVVETDGRELFFQPLIPSYRLIIIGAVRIAQALAPMASAAGLDVTVVDPRGAFATDQRFPGVKLVREWPDKAILDLGLDPHTAVVTLTHDAKPDDMALELAVRSDAFYVGALGSNKTHAARTERLKKSGNTREDIKRIHAPVGIDIGARTPAEIAVSILGQVIAVKNKKAACGGAHGRE